MKIAIIGVGAIAKFVQNKLEGQGITIAAHIVRHGKECAPGGKGACVSTVSDLPKKLDLLVDCAGHEALHMHAIEALETGIDVLSLSVGALADKDLQQKLTNAATKGNSKLYLTSGAIGGLDALRAASVGSLEFVKYIGRKPPIGWMGSPAEEKLNLLQLKRPTAHFIGSARDAAINYPKNANVAAAVALSSLGFDDTLVELIADPTISANIHEVEACGDFGQLRFSIQGNSLPDNPRSSALAAMGIISVIMNLNKKITF